MIPLEWFCCMLALFVGCWAGYGVLLEPSSMGTYLFTILVQCVKPRRDWADDQLGTRGQDEYPPLPPWSMGRLVPNTRAGGYARVHSSNCFYPSTSLHLYLSWRAQSARGLEDKNQVRLERTNDQLALSYPFFSLSNTDLTKSYFTSAFDLSRQFLYEWTVNWRFIPENVFLSKEFSNNLLFFHVRPFLVPT